MEMSSSTLLRRNVNKKIPKVTVHAYKKFSNENMNGGMALLSSDGKSFWRARWRNPVGCYFSKDFPDIVTGISTFEHLEEVCEQIECTGCHECLSTPDHRAVIDRRRPAKCAQAIRIGWWFVYILAIGMGAYTVFYFVSDVVK